MDLTAAYDTVWRNGLMFKLLQIIPCKRIATTLNNMLSDRSFQVFLDDAQSRPRKLNNGLPQGSVLAPLLFNLYTYDLPDTISKKFAYADDLAIATQHQRISRTEQILEEDLSKLNEYFKKWRLCPSISKTEVTCFHLNNKLAKTKLKVRFNNVYLTHNPSPKYLGVTLDRTLSFKEHLSNTAAKLKTRNNIIQKLASTTWGAPAKTLRSASMGLVFSAAEYCSPVWLNSAHTNKVDCQLNTSMRIISGTISSTPTRFLPVLSNIQPAKLRRQNALLREYGKINANNLLPIHEDIEKSAISRLKSRHPPLKLARELKSSNFEAVAYWKNEWNSSSHNDLFRIDDPTTMPAGHDLPRKTWVSLNRVRTNNARCAATLYKWGAVETPFCDCGNYVQNMKHVTSECALRMYRGDPADFIKASPAVTDWLKNLDIQL